jgi:hypothetical protein
MSVQNISLHKYIENDTCKIIQDTKKFTSMNKFVIHIWPKYLFIFNLLNIATMNAHII